MVDFGLAKSFRDGRGRHIPCVKKSGMTGTARYTTVLWRESADVCSRRGKGFGWE